MEEIIDNKVESKNGEFLTLVSILCSITALICFGSMTNLLSGTITASESLKQPPMVVIRLVQIMTGVSIFSLITSYLRKERKTWKTWIATILSVLLFILFFGSIGFYYFIELTK